MGGSPSCQIHFPVAIGNDLPLVVIGGINVLESLELALEVGSAFRDACAALGLGYVFKASFDKANRTALHSFRGPGLEQGLAWLQQIQQQLQVPVLTDVHEPGQRVCVPRHRSHSSVIENPESSVLRCVDSPQYLIR